MFVGCLYMCLHACVCVCVCVYCFLGDVLEGVKKNYVRVTWRVSFRYSTLNCEPLGFFRGGGAQGLINDESDHQTRHISTDQPIAKFICNSCISPSRRQSLYTFIREYIEFHYFALKCQDLNLNQSKTLLSNGEKSGLGV